MRNEKASALGAGVVRSEGSSARWGVSLAWMGLAGEGTTTTTGPDSELVVVGAGTA